VATLTCPACGGRLRAWRSIASFEPELGPRRLELAVCVQCGSAVTLGDPVPEAHAAGAYGGGRPRGAQLAAPVLGCFDRQRLALLPPPPGRLVDAGAGRGRFVAAALAAGYDAVGIEPSLRSVDPALAPALRAAAILDAGVAAGSVDVVTLWHVLEHLETPAAELGAIHDWLVPGGALLVGVPNFSSLQARLGGDRWYHLDLPRHRVHYTVTGLASRLRRSGFELVSVHGVLAEHNPFGMWQSLVSTATAQPSYLYNLLKRNAPVASWDLALTLLAVPWLPVAAAVELAAGAVGFGGTVAVLARRV
jgi:SAM-dependent methyltransferase